MERRKFLSFKNIFLNTSALSIHSVFLESIHILHEQEQHLELEKR